MTNPTTAPPALIGWAARALGARPAVRDVSPPRESSRVWRLDLPGALRFSLKVSPEAVRYERETLALRSAAPALGAGGAPQLRASSAEDPALLLTAAAGRPLKQPALSSVEEARAHRRGGALLARLHAAGDLSGPRRAEAAQSPQAAADSAEGHLAVAGDRLNAPEQNLVRHLAEELRAVPPLPLAYVHGDAWDRNLMWSTSRQQECLAAIDAVSCLVRGPKLDGPGVTARGRRTLDRLMAGVFA
ncbi:phosphotransferase [Streptomyces racemochromogenes]|uniref:Phosphotransferase n=1 Tax=Streptomyces racemochromogenes TaxID=67353 RepID=A0ABW7PB46_9ACTN